MTKSQRADALHRAIVFLHFAGTTGCRVSDLARALRLERSTLYKWLRRPGPLADLATLRGDGRAVLWTKLTLSPLVVPLVDSSNA